MSNNVLIRLALAVCIAGAPFASAQEDIPVVPASVMKRGVPTPVKPSNTDSESDRGGSEPETELTVTPGVNEIIPVAIGHPNRIVTPFSDPEVISTTLSVGAPSEDGSCGEVCIRDNVVYVATDKDAPATMFITESGSESQAISLTLVPRRIPPKEVFVKLEGQSNAIIGQSRPKAERWETSQPYVQTIRTVFRSIALGKIPQGYSINDVPADVSTPNCEQSALRFNFTTGQMMMGHNLTVFIGVATNISDSTVEFNQPSCGNWNVAAVTSWPKVVLHPGERTEVYVAVKQDRSGGSQSVRPSLLGRYQ